MKRSRDFCRGRKRRATQRHYWANTRTFDPIMWTHSYQRIGGKGGEEAHWCQVNKGRVAHKYFIHRTARYTDVCGRTINHWTIDGGECALTVPRVTHRQRCSIKINGRLTFAACHARNAASRMKRRCVDIFLAKRSRRRDRFISNAKRTVGIDFRRNRPARSTRFRENLEIYAWLEWKWELKISHVQNRVIQTCRCVLFQLCVVIISLKATKLEESR